MDQKITILVAPLLKNSSCDNGNSSTFLSNLGVLDVLQAFFIMTLTLAIVGANSVVIIVINCRRYASFIHPQVCDGILKPPAHETNSLHSTAQIFDNFTSIKRFSNRSFNNTFRNNTCLVTLLALRRDLLSNSGEGQIVVVKWENIFIVTSSPSPVGAATWCTCSTMRRNPRLYGR